MNARRTALVLGAALLVCGLETSPNEARAQSYSSQIRLPPGRAALVRTLLNGVSARRRAEAAEALGETGDQRVLEALATAAAHDSEPEVRGAARRAIRQIRGDQGQWEGGPGPFPRPQPQDPNVVLVESWYQRYLGRSGDRSGLATFAGMLARGVSAEDVQAGILASDEFWRRYGGTAPGFIRGLYESVLNRTPNRAEVDLWGRRYNLLRGDRSRLAQEFVAAAQQELLGSQRYNNLYR
jgi:HEAT repeats/Domain of unknown function (DUF4214)